MNLRFHISSLSQVYKNQNYPVSNFVTFLFCYFHLDTCKTNHNYCFDFQTLKWHRGKFLCPGMTQMCRWNDDIVSVLWAGYLTSCLILTATSRVILSRTQFSVFVWGLQLCCLPVSIVVSRNRDQGPHSRHPSPGKPAHWDLLSG